MQQQTLDLAAFLIMSINHCIVLPLLPPLEYSLPNARPLDDQPALLERINSATELMRQGFVSVVHLWVESAGGGDRGVTLRYAPLSIIDVACSNNSSSHSYFIPLHYSHRLGRLILNTERWELVIGKTPNNKLDDESTIDERTKVLIIFASFFNHCYCIITHKWWDLIEFVSFCETFD